jgi:hypothetical protein
MPHADLLAAHDQAAATAEFVALLSRSLGGLAFEERESSNYPPESRYWRARLGRVEVRVMRDDLDHAWDGDGLPFWLAIHLREGSERELLDLVDGLVRQRLLPLGFRVALVSRFGTLSEARSDYR